MPFISNNTIVPSSTKPRTIPVEKKRERVSFFSFTCQVFTKEILSSFRNVVRDVIDWTKFGRMFHWVRVVEENRRESDFPPFGEGNT